MKYDVFFSISQTPVDGYTPSEAQMFRNFFDQVVAADRLGFGTAWLAESHLSSEVQKRNKRPVIPHWKGEVGLNVDFVQLASQIFRRTERIEVGSAIVNILCMGGPVAHAERVAAFLALHGLDENEKRRIHLGFAAGRFDFMNRASGVLPRTPVEEAAGRAWKGKVFGEAAEVFLRLLNGEILHSGMIPQPSFSREDFRSDADWARIQEVAGSDADRIPLERFWTFEEIKIVPQEFRRDLVQFIVGSHDARTQDYLQRFAPVHVFNLSITQSAIIEATHERLSRTFHPAGGPWKREYMPRTVFVFLNEEDGLSAEERSAGAQREAKHALEAYWTALEGTIDPTKVARATDNALVGNAEQIAQEMAERFNPDDRVMLWFDFFNHDSERVIRNMERFVQRVVPRIEELVAQR